MAPHAVLAYWIPPYGPILPPVDDEGARGACIVYSPSCGTGDYHYYHLEATKLPGESVQSLIWHWIELY